MTKTKVTLSIDEKKVKQLKIKAIKLGITLSDLMSISAGELDTSKYEKETT